MTSLPFIKRKSFIDILSHIKPHFNPAYIKDVISKHVLHCQSITFYRVDLLGKCFQNTFIAIHVCPPLTHVYCLKVWWRLNLRVWWGSIYTAKKTSARRFWHCTTSWGNCISHILFLDHDSCISDILQTFFRDVKQTSVGFPMPL